MSRENVEVVRRGFEAYARGDVEAMLEGLDQEVWWKQVEEPAPVYGRDGVREALRRWDETWDNLQVEVDEYIDAGECVVALIRLRGLGRTSKVPVEMASYHVFTVRNGKVARMFEFGPGKRAEALEAAGLSE
jgi:ketosteroid isomerase-like protein